MVVLAYRKKTLTLQRAYFSEGYNGTLENILRYSFNKLSKAKDRVVPIDLVTSQLFAAFEEAKNGKGVFVRVFDFEEGAIGVINLETTDSNVAVEEFYHPNKQDFLKDEMVFYVVRDYVIACNLKNKAGTFAGSVLALAHKGEVLAGDVRMRIEDVPDQTTLEKIDRVGVKKVDFSITSFLGNVDFSAQAFVPRILRMAVGSPANPKEIKKRSNTLGRMILSRGKYKAEEIQKDPWLTAIATELMDSGFSEPFTIILEDNTRISQSNLRKSKAIQLPRYANSYSFDHAKLALMDYFELLQAEGTIRF